MTSKELTQMFLEKDYKQVSENVEKIYSRLNYLQDNPDVPEDFDGEWDELLITLLCITD